MMDIRYVLIAVVAVVVVVAVAWIVIPVLRPKKREPNPYDLMAQMVVAEYRAGVEDRKRTRRLLPRPYQDPRRP